MVADRAARMNVVDASVAGPDHARRGVPCQDRAAVEVIGDTTVLLAVSDGLGSATHAETGAEAAAGAAVRAAAAFIHAAPDAPPGEVLTTAMWCARAAMLRAADGIGCTPRDVAATLMIAMVTPDRASITSIGDGSAITETDAGFAVALGPPEREYVNEVDPLTMDGWERAVRSQVIDGPIRSLTAFTDGCQHAAITPDGDVGAAFIPPIVAHVREHGEASADALRGLLAGDKVAEHSGDDKTMVVVTMGSA